MLGGEWQERRGHHAGVSGGNRLQNDGCVILLEGM